MLEAFSRLSQTTYDFLRVCFVAYFSPFNDVFKSEGLGWAEPSPSSLNFLSYGFPMFVIHS
jgi:hypothetical protein